MLQSLMQMGMYVIVSAIFIEAEILLIEPWCDIKEWADGLGYDLTVALCYGPLLLTLSHSLFVLCC